MSTRQGGEITISIWLWLGPDWENSELAENTNSGWIFSGSRVHEESGSYFIQYDEVLHDGKNVPCTYVSLREEFVCASPRRRGKYRKGEDRAILDTPIDHPHAYVLLLRASSLEAMWEFRRQIRCGEIWPDVDYDAEQKPPTQVK